MSVSVDVSFLSNEEFSIKPNATIFDEFEGLFNVPKEDFPTDLPIKNSNSTFIDSVDTRPIKLLSEDIHDEKTCDIPSLVSTDFLLNDESHDDQQLFMVEDDDLKPLTLPFMMPGIYKKIPRSSRPDIEETTGVENASNVFISTSEKTGKILPANVFREAYVNLENETEEVEEIHEESTKPVEDSLTTLAYDILKLSNRDNIVIDRQRNEIIRHEDELRRKTVYRFLTPQTLGLTQEMMVTLTRNDVGLNPPNKSKRGRPRKNKEQDKCSKPKSPPIAKTPTTPNTPPPNVQRTRSGRIIKPLSTKLPPPPSEPEADNLEPENAASFMRNFLQELKDSEYLYEPIPKPTQPPDTPPPAKKRNLPANSSCPTCNKIFLGKRMNQHFQSHPSHRPSTERQEILEEMSLFKFLVNKVKRTSLAEDQRAEVFLNEISDFVEQLQARSSQIIRNTSGLQFVNSKTSKVLGIPEGHYSLDVTAIDAPPETFNNFDSIVPPPAPRLDYNLSISLDDTLTDAKLNLSGPLPSEESLLRTVEDLMKEGMKKLDHDLLHPPQQPVIHYDHASDNAVEAVTMKETSQTAPILDLSLDLFQFNSN